MPINFENVSFVYNFKTPLAKAALNNVSLEIKENTFTAIVGKTGCGKSTLIQHINGLLIPTSGRIKYKEFINSNNKKERTKKFNQLRQQIGVVFQFSESQLFEETIEKDVMFGPLNFGKNKEEALKLAHKALEEVGLDSSFYKRSPFELSGGERRRVAIAGILAIDPSIIILDEPTAGLDPKGIKEIMSLFERLYQNGKTIILVTHDMDIVLRYATDVIVLDNGNVVDKGKPINILKNNCEKYSLDIPLSYKCADILIKHGLDIDIRNINGLTALVNEIKRKVKK